MSSWFTIGVEVKRAWDSHSFVKGALTGSFLGNALVEHGLKRCPLYLKIRENIAVHAASQVLSKSNTGEREISAKILENLLNKTHISKVGIALKNKIFNMTRKDLFNCG